MNAKKIISIMLVFCWMIMMFGFSGQQGEGSGNLSRTVCEIIIDIVNIRNKYTDVEAENMIKVLEPYIRKIAHYAIYTLGGTLIANCIYQFCKETKKIINISTIIGVIYAITDELHQLMIAGRSGKINDVIIDSLGVVTGIIFFLTVNQIGILLKKKKYNFKGGEKCL